MLRWLKGNAIEERLSLLFPRSRKHGFGFYTQHSKQKIKKERAIKSNI
jgi:hypothetical protein